MSNTELWERHRSPPKDACKSFNRPGGFKGTAIDPMWLILEATREWGPMGAVWGFKVADETIERYADLKVLHTCRILVWYPTKASQSSDGYGWIESYGNTWLVTENKNGPVYDDEASKKSLTDAISKALSWLGFGADVHMGIFDGNKYADLFSSAEATTESSDNSEDQQEESWASGSDELVSTVKENYQKIVDAFEEGEVWHRQVLANFLETKLTEEEKIGKAIKERLDDDKLLRLIELQNVKMKTNKE